MSKRPIHQYPESQLNTAMAAIRQGMKIREASRKYEVPRGTLQDRMHGRVPEGPRRMGPEPELSTEEEKSLVKWCTNLVKCGFPIKRDDLLNTVKNIIIEEGRKSKFKNGRPGLKWYKGFLKRNPELAHRTPEGISKGRAAVTTESIKKWFSVLKEYLQKLGVGDILDDPTRIYNGDETSFMLCPKTGKVIAPKGYKNIYQIQKGPEKESITVLLFFSASGEILYPCVVFPYVRVPANVGNSLPSEWILGKSESGWMKSEIFYDYIEKGLDKWLNTHNIKKPVLVFVDGHKSHLTMNLSKYCADNQIILYALPPNTTHMMQPADVSVFKPLKSDWKLTVRNWQMQFDNENAVVTKSTFCPLLKIALGNTNLRQSIINGFKKCGLYPFDPTAVDYTKCVQNSMEALHERGPEHDQNLPAHIDLESAERVINYLKPNLIHMGIDVTLILEEIETLKSLNLQENDQGKHSVSLPVIDDSCIFKDTNLNQTLNNLTVDSSILDTFIVDENGILLPAHNISSCSEKIVGTSDQTEETFDTGQNELHFKNCTKVDTNGLTEVQAADKIQNKSCQVISDNLIKPAKNMFPITSQQQRHDTSGVLDLLSQNTSANNMELPTSQVNQYPTISLTQSNSNFLRENKENVTNISSLFSGVQAISSPCSSPLLRKDLTLVSPTSSRGSSPVMRQQDLRISSSVCARNSPSPIMLKHLKIPIPIKKAQKTNTSINRIGAISSEEWREFETKKEEAKQNKRAAILHRKQERLRLKKERENTAAKRKADRKVKQRHPKTRRLNMDVSETVTKITCGECDELLISDVEENDLKNIGCDQCPSWYHLKCCAFAGKLYEDVVNDTFFCKACNKSK